MMQQLAQNRRLTVY